MIKIRMTRLFVLCFVLIIVSLSCASRYRMDLFLTLEQERYNLNIEQSRLLPNTILVFDQSNNRITNGIGNTSIVTVGTKVKDTIQANYPLFQMDEYLRCDLYIQFPDIIKPATSDLQENALLEILEKYEVPAEEKLFMPVSGTCTVDSITPQHIFCSVTGEFANNKGRTLTIDGAFKIEQ